MVADYLGLGGVADTTHVSPIVAEHDVELPQRSSIATGQVLGLNQVVVIKNKSGIEVVRLDITMAVGIANSHDAVEVDGDPPIRLVVPGGVPGDASTAAIVVNTARHLLGKSGLFTVAQLPPAFAFDDRQLVS
jgi:4-hydroxy-tetrahydrodipicolinate reductase